MDIDAYQDATDQTSGGYKRIGEDHALQFLALGIAGEAGEVADLIKKQWRAGHLKPC